MSGNERNISNRNSIEGRTIDGGCVGTSRARHVGASAIAIIVATTFSVAPSIAQTMQAAAPAVAEVIVTGQRKSETLQKAPVSVTVFDSKLLADAGVKRASDFISMTPGVSFVGGTIGVGDNQVNIRGINGARDAGGSFAYVVDGILIPNAETFNRTYANLSQIEVLEGPQGAIYGRNAEAGAIVVTTKAPTDTFEGSATTGVGQYGTVYNQSTISGPLIANKLFASLTYDYRGTSGQFKNTYLNNSSVDRDHTFDVGGRIIWKPTDDWTFDLKGRYSQVTASALDFNVDYEIPAIVPYYGAAANQDVNDHKFQYVSNIEPIEKQKTIDLSLKADHDLGWGRLSTYAAYNRVSDAILSDGTLAAFGFFDNANNETKTNVCSSSLAALAASGFQYPAPQTAGFLGPYTASTCDGYQYLASVENDYSGEIRITSEPGGPLRWSGGLYYLNSSRQDGISVGDDLGLGIISSLDNPLNSISPTAQLYNDLFVTNALGAFGSLDYDITPKLTLSGGFRYDVDWNSDRSLVPAGNLQDFINVLDGGPANGTFYPLNPGLIANPNGIPTKTAIFQQPQPKISLRYTPRPTVSFYASYGVGFKSGGFNRAGTAATIANIAAETGSDVNIGDEYKKEVSNAFEIGVKGSFLERRLSYQLATYSTQVHNLQYSEFFTNDQGQLRVVSNIKRVDLDGAELGLQYQAASWLKLIGGANYTYSRIMANDVRPDTVGNESPYTPQYTANIGADLSFPLTDRMNLIGNVTTNFTGPTWFSVVQKNYNPTIFGVDAYFGNSQRAAYTTTDLRLGVSGPNFELVGFAKNLFDEHYLSEVSPAPEFGGSFVAQAPGRLVGVELTLHFKRLAAR